jgi:hypothetical protein
MRIHAHRHLRQFWIGQIHAGALARAARRCTPARLGHHRLEPGKVAVARASAAALNDMQAFCSQHTHWVVAGCYAGLVSATFGFQPRLIFMNPGPEQCLANTRSGDMSLQAHVQCFAGYAGLEDGVTTRPVLEPADDKVVSWLLSS